MILKLPIPIKSNTQKYNEIEIERPKASTIAETQKLMQDDRYGAIINFLHGSVLSIGDISDKSQIKSLIRKMPYRSAEFALIKIMLLYNSEDGIEGMYECPRCKNKIISQKIMEGEDVISDTRDFINSLMINYSDETNFGFDLSERVDIKNSQTNEIVSFMESFEMEYPTLEHCMRAGQKVGFTDEFRLQLQIYVESINKVNGAIIDNSWRNMYGLNLFLNISKIEDLKKIQSEIEKFGLQKRVEKNCPKCGKSWQVLLDTSNFFDFGR